MPEADAKATVPAALVELLNDALPQTQCTRCGYADCRAYAQAIADGQAAINRCPPGGAEGPQGGPLGIGQGSDEQWRLHPADHDEPPSNSQGHP